MNRIGRAEEGIRFIVVMFIAIILSNWALNHAGKMEILKGGMLDYYVMDFTSASFVVWCVWALVQMYEAGRTWLLDLFVPAVLHSVVLLMQFTAVAANLGLVGAGANLTFAEVCMYLTVYAVLAAAFIRTAFIPWAVRAYAKTLKKHARAAERRYENSLLNEGSRSKLPQKANDFKFEDLSSISINVAKSDAAGVEDVVFLNLFEPHRANYILSLKGFDLYFPSGKTFQDILNTLTPRFTSTPYLFQIALFWPMIAVFQSASMILSKIGILSKRSRLLRNVASVQLKIVDEDKNKKLFNKTLNED